MPRRFVAPAALAAAVIVPVLLAEPAAAAAPEDAPGAACADGNFFVIEYAATYEGADGIRDGAYERAVPTRGGCASSWAHRDGQLSTAAIAAQCRTGLEVRFGPYPIIVRFAQTYTLHNRADCIAIMSAVAHGQIDPGSAPLFPGGTRPA